MDESASKQLTALAEVTGRLEREEIPYWLFGGWAVDFHAGSVTRPHGDVDLAVWFEHVPRIVELLLHDGWRYAPEEDEDGGTGYERGAVRLELTYLLRDADGRICIPLSHGLVAWREGTFGNDVAELRGMSVRLISRASLLEGKSSPREDPADAAKDRADARQLGAPKVLPEVSLVPLTDEARRAFLATEIADYAEQQVRDAGWPRDEALDRAEVELPNFEREHAQAVEQGHQLWSAIDPDGRTVGWLWVKPSGKANSGVAYLEQITVEKTARRQGYGRAMLVALEQRLAADGIDELLLDTMSGNEASRRLYASAGYEQTDDDDARCFFRKSLR